MGPANSTDGFAHVMVPTTILGRIRKGPAPENLAVPPAVFVDDTTIKLG